MQHLSRRLAFAAAIALGGVLAPAASSPATEAATPALTVTVHCYSNPERTVVRNNRTFSIRVISVTSIYAPRSNEPFAVSTTIPAGGQRTFYSGYAADADHVRTLTRQYIYSNSVGTKEGARVVRSSGTTYGDRC